MHAPTHPGTMHADGHRGFVLWTPDAVVVAHNAAGFRGSEGVHDGRKVARLSLDSGRTFLDGRVGATVGLDPVDPAAVVIPFQHDCSFVAPTAALSKPPHYLTCYC